MTEWRRLLGALALALLLTAGVACSRGGDALPLSGAEPMEAPPLAQSGPSTLGPDDAAGLGAFPTFLPPVAIGSETQECQLGTDPYSTCI